MLIKLFLKINAYFFIKDAATLADKTRPCYAISLQTINCLVRIESAKKK